MFRPQFVLILALFAVACSKGDNNFIADAEPEFAIEGGGFLQLKMPTDEDKNRTQDALMIRNSGDGPMTIQSIEWIDQPERLVPLAKRGTGCDAGSCDGAKSEDGEDLNDPVCLTTTMTCNGTGFPATPFELGAQLRQDIEFLVKRGSRELTCPTPSIELPATILEEEYCGALRITTNAKTDSSDGLIVEGVATVFFLAPEESSGLIAVEPNFMEFLNAAAGVSQEQTLSLTNTGEQDLEVRQISVVENRDWFEIVPNDDPVPTTIAPGNSMSWAVRMTPPAGTSEDELNFTTTLEVDSSAGNASTGIIALQVSAGAGDAPIFETDTDILRFDQQAMQTLTISNTGSATLTVSGLDVKPTASETFYTITVDGGAFNGLTIPADESRTVDIAFTRPAGNTDSSVGILEVNHNDDNLGRLSELLLLGDEGDAAFATLAPTSFTFLVGDGNTESREFVIRNIGTQALDITNVTYSAPTVASQFTITGAPTTIAAGAVQKLTVDYSGLNSTPFSGLIMFETNSGLAVELSVLGLDSGAALPVPMINASNPNPTVGTPVTLNSMGSMPESSRANGRWVLLARPAGSSVWVNQTGEDVTFLPDVAGAYEFALILRDSDREAQLTQTITVQ